MVSKALFPVLSHLGCKIMLGGKPGRHSQYSPLFGRGMQAQRAYVPQFSKHQKQAQNPGLLTPSPLLFPIRLLFGKNEPIYSTQDTRDLGFLSCRISKSPLDMTTHQKEIPLRSLCLSPGSTPSLLPTSTGFPLGRNTELPGHTALLCGSTSRTAGSLTQLPPLGLTLKLGVGVGVGVVADPCHVLIPHSMADSTIWQLHPFPGWLGYGFRTPGNRAFRAATSRRLESVPEATRKRQS